MAGYIDCYTCQKSVPRPHSAHDKLMFCNNCNQYVVYQKHPTNLHDPPHARCENYGIYCVSCHQCSPTGTAKCKYCNNTSVKINLYNKYPVRK